MKILIKEFYQSIKGEKEFPISTDLMLETEKISDQIYEKIPKKFLDFSTRKPTITVPNSKGKILVTGASGFVGKATVQKLLAEGYEVRAFVRKLSYIDDLEKLGIEIFFGDIRHYDSFFNAAKGVKGIIHLAAALGVPFSDYMEITVGGTQNLIKIVKELKVPKIIYMSSMSVYDVTDCQPGQVLDENQIYERRPLDRGAYTASKLEAEKIVKSSMEQSTSSWTILRPSMIVGSNTKSLLKPVGIPLSSRLNVVFGMGMDRVRLIPVDDVTNAIILCLKTKASNGKIYNLNHPDSLSKRKYLSLLSKKSNKMFFNIYVPHFVMRSMICLQEYLLGKLNKKPFLTVYRYNTSQKSVIISADRINFELNWSPQASLNDFIFNLI
jgi:nucleoside-diphosphate-sugar epimerase